MNCIKCGVVSTPGEKFCQECGTELPKAAAAAPKAAPDSDEMPAAGAGPNTAIGKNSILSNSQINTTNTTTTTTVNNTTIEDDTKKSVVCAVSGKRVLFIESVCCRGCEKDVSLEYFNEKTRRCENCHQEYLKKYRTAYQNLLESGGGIDRQERAELNILAQQLFLTEEETSNIEIELRNLKATEIENDATGFDDLFEMELSIVKQEIFKKNNLSSALLRLEDLFKQVQTNDEISCFYFLLKAIKLPGQYVTNYEGASYDEFWENYWLFLAYLNKGDHGKVMKTFRDNYAKFSHRKNEIILAEIVYLLIRFQSDQTDVLIENATNKLALIEGINGNLLTKLYKSNTQLLDTFDFGLLKFSDLTPPSEPGMKEYHLFFLNHLYKIEPEAPKAKAVEAPEVKAAPQVPNAMTPTPNPGPAVPKVAPPVPKAPPVVSKPFVPHTPPVPGAKSMPPAPNVPLPPQAKPQGPKIPGPPPGPPLPKAPSSSKPPVPNIPTPGKK